MVIGLALLAYAPIKNARLQREQENTAAWLADIGEEAGLPEDESSAFQQEVTQELQKGTDIEKIAAIWFPAGMAMAGFLVIIVSEAAAAPSR